MTHHVDSTRHGNQLSQLWDDYCVVVADRDALRAQVADLERRLADLSRMVVAAEVEDGA